MRLLKINDLVRIGRNYDGGYVLSASLIRRSSVLLSFGINDDWSFEEDFCKRSGVRCYGFDFSVSKELFLKRSLLQLRFFFGDVIKRRKIGWERFGLARDNFRLYRNFGSFFKKNTFLSYGVDRSTHGYFKSLDDILQEYLRGKNDIFLKVDIEGFEFRIMEDILKNKHRFHGLAMEIHGIHENENGFREFLAQLEAGFYVYHVHANNYSSLEKKGGFPNVIEISCIRQDLVNEPEFYDGFSHLPVEGIDFPNDLKSADLKW